MRREFTGRHMTSVLVGGFGIVVAVNLLMATFAIGGFGGFIVENTYGASQKFNGWLDAAEQSRALGWDAQVARGEAGELAVATTAVPLDAVVTASVRPRLGTAEALELALQPVGDAPGSYRSLAAVPAGRWIVRLVIVSGEDRWAEELPLE